MHAKTFNTGPWPGVEGFYVIRYLKIRYLRYLPANYRALPPNRNRYSQWPEMMLVRTPPDSLEYV